MCPWMSATAPVPAADAAPASMVELVTPVPVRKAAPAPVVELIALAPRYISHAPAGDAAPAPVVAYMWLRLQRMECIPMLFQRQWWSSGGAHRTSSVHCTPAPVVEYIAPAVSYVTLLPSWSTSYKHPQRVTFLLRPWRSTYRVRQLGTQHQHHL